MAGNIAVIVAAAVPGTAPGQRTALGGEVPFRERGLAPACSGLGENGWGCPGTRWCCNQEGVAVGDGEGHCIGHFVKSFC